MLLKIHQSLGSTLYLDTMVDPTKDSTVNDLAIRSTVPFTNTSITENNVI